jgi:hypothetical protein
MHFWRIAQYLGDLTTSETACCTAEEAGRATSPCNVELLGVALLHGYLPFALALVLILPTRFALEARVEAYRMTFDGFVA